MWTCDLSQLIEPCRTFLLCKTEIVTVPTQQNRVILGNKGGNIYEALGARYSTHGLQTSVSRPRGHWWDGRVSGPLGTS